MLKKISMQNGLRIISDTMTGVKTVSLGFWVPVGSRHEETDEAGVAHLLEHMSFKGTTRRTAAELAIKIDSMGGQLNAFTTAEYTAYCVCVLDRHLEEAFALLAEMLFESTWSEQEIEKEKTVILQEYDMYEDTPEELIQDLYYQKVWPEHPLGRNILGSRKNIQSFNREKLARFHNKHYHAGNLLITAAGACKQERLIDLSERYLSTVQAGAPTLLNSKPPIFAFIDEHVVKKLEQTQLIIGTEGFSHTDERWFAAQLLNTILGGSVSSRLFQTVREKMGLTYSIGSGLTCFHDCGMFQITAAANPGQADAVREASMLLVRQLCENGAEQDELQRAKEQVVSNLLMGLESSVGRMNRAAKLALYGLPLWSSAQFVKKIENVSLELVNETAVTLFSRPFSCLILGPKVRKEK